MANPNAVVKVKASSLTITIFVIVLAVLAIVGTLYLLQVYAPTHEGHDQAGATIVKMIGLNTPIVGGNHLANVFADADGDLVADPPTDASKCIDPPTLIFSYIAQEDPEKSRDAWKPFTEYLSKITGKPVDYKLMTDTADELKALRDGSLHVAGLNSGAVPTAVDAAGFVPTCLVPGINGAAVTSTVFIVPAGSSIATLADIRGKEIAYTYPNSNSGFKAPILTLLEKASLKPGVDYDICYSQGHEESIVGIARKKYKAAAVSNDMLQRALATGEIAKDGFQVVYETESFPTAAIGYAYNLKPELAAKVRQALMTFDWKGTSLEKELASSDKTKFVSANYKNDFSLLRKIDDVTGTRHEIK